MTHIERYVLLLTAIDGKKPSNSRLNQFADDFISYRRDQLEAAGIDPYGKFTNIQKASVVLDAFAHHGKSVSEAMVVRRAVEK